MYTNGKVERSERASERARERARERGREGGREGGMEGGRGWGGGVGWGGLVRERQSLSDPDKPYKPYIYTKCMYMYV